MAEPLVASLPLECVIGVGYRVRLVALDPATGNTVAGVTVSDGSIFCTHLGGPLDDLAPLPQLVPSDGIV